MISGNALPSTAAGAQLVGKELGKQTRTAANTLLAVGIIQLVVGGILTLVLMNAAPSAGLELNVPVLVGTIIGVSVVFFCLYFWARVSPLPPTIVGLVVYGTLIAINVVSAISMMSQNDGRGSGIAGIGIGWLDILIVVLLSRGISAALKQRKLAEAELTA